MANSKSNYPAAQLGDLEPDFVSETIENLRQLNSKGKPKTDQELTERIDQYFQFCQNTGNRPGIESLCMSLCITRTTLFNWNNGINCTQERQEIIIKAKAFIASFMEQAVLRGKINPASGIFLMKNWLGYKDSYSFEEATETKKESIISTREQTLYTDTTEKWLDDADIKEEKKVLKTLKVTDNHKYVAPTATPAPTEEAAETEEVTETPEVTEAADTTTTPEAPSYSTDTSLTVKDGDTVNIDYVGKIDGTAFDGGSTNGQGTDLVIGSGSYIDDFEDQLVGAHPGDEVEVTVTFPDDYSAADLAGKEAVFDVTVNGIYE